MPRRLPMSVVLRGVIRQTALQFSRAFRLLLVAFIWFGAVPWATSWAFSFYFGWHAYRALSPTDGSPMFHQTMSVVFECMQGAVITAAMILVFLGLMLLRDYLATQAALEESARTRTETGTGTRRERRTAQPSSTPTSTPRRPSHWLDQVTPREYRSYLRRRELYRQRMENDSRRISELIRMSELTREGHATPEVLPGDENGHPLLDQTNDPNPFEELEPSIISHNPSTVDVPSQARQSDNRRSREPSREVPEGSSSRENIRCRICNSRTCVDRDHVLMASRGNNELGEEPEPETSAQQASPISPHHAMDQRIIDARPAADEAALPNPIFRIGIGLDVDAPPITLCEFIGLYGSFSNLFQNAAIIYACNLLMLHAFLFVPHLTGLALTSGFLQRILLTIGRAMYAAHMAAIGESALSGLLPNLYETVQRAGQVALMTVHSIAPSYIDVNALIVHLSSSFTRLRSMATFASESFVGFVFNVIIGYSILSILGAIYISSAKKNGWNDKLNHYLRHALAFCGTFLKLTIMFLLELVVFPIICGWVVNLSTCALFGASAASRFAFASEYPATANALHWMIGAMFMMHVSSMLTRSRQAFRSGLFHRLRNPSDPDYHPLREMIDRPMTTQLSRLIISASVYLSFAALVFGLFTRAIRCVAPSILPLHLRFNDPVAEVPLDILLHAFIKLAFNSLRPRLFGQALSYFSRQVLRIFSLSSYFYGGRYLNQESFPRGGRWVFVPDQDRVYPAERLREMANRPVGPMDIAKLPVVEGRPKTHGGNSINEEAIGQVAEEISARSRHHSRGHSSTRRTETPAKGFTVVFRPHFLPLRIIFFALVVWAVLQAAMVGLFVVPVWIGRRIFSLFLNYPVHELYTFAAGFLVLTLAMRMVHGLISALARLERGCWETIVFYYPYAILKTVYVCSYFLLVFPTFLGLYIAGLLAPLLTTQDQTLIIFLITCWSLGMSLMKLLYLLRRYTLSQPRIEAIHRLLQDGWKNVDLRAAHKDLIVPYLFKWIALLLGPPLFVMLIGPLFEFSFEQILLLQRWSYSLTLLVPLITTAISAIMTCHRAITNRIRDDTYLVGRRLHNLENRRLPVGLTSTPGSPIVA